MRLLGRLPTLLGAGLLLLISCTRPLCLGRLPAFAALRHSATPSMVTVGPHRLQDRDVKAAVFDVDGTLIDTMPLFYPSWFETGKQPQFNLEVTEDDFYRMAGLPLPDVVQTLHLAQRGTPASEEFVKAFLAEKLRLHRLHEEEAGHPAAIPAVVALAKEWKARGVPIAIATSGLPDVVIEHLRHAGLEDLVPSELMVFAKDVPRGKPDPAIYLEAARRLGVDPACCRAYEDGESGLQSAFLAGMEVIDVTFMDSYPASPALKRAKQYQIEKRTWLPAAESGAP